MLTVSVVIAARRSTCATLQCVYVGLFVKGLYRWGRVQSRRQSEMNWLLASPAVGCFFFFSCCCCCSVRARAHPPATAHRPHQLSNQRQKALFFYRQLFFSFIFHSFFFFFGDFLVCYDIRLPNRIGLHVKQTERQINQSQQQPTSFRENHCLLCVFQGMLKFV